MPQARTTMRDIADAAGVSTATVSNVLAGRTTRVTPATRDRVLAAAQALRYRPNTAARAMRTGRTGIVHLSLHMLSDPWSLAVADAVNARGLEHGLSTLILADGNWPQALESVTADVAFIDSPETRPDAQERLAELVARGQRVVVFTERLEPDGFDVVRSDPLPGAELAIAHLREHTDDIACLADQRLVDLHRAGRRTRYSVYAEQAEAGAVSRPRLVTYEQRSQASAFRAAFALLQDGPPPAALYCTTDFAALGALQAAHALGIDVPGRMLLSGLGNTPAGSMSTPSLTTAGPADVYGEIARILVDAALDPGGAGGTRYDFRWELIPRETTGGAAV